MCGKQGETSEVLNVMKKLYPCGKKYIADMKKKGRQLDAAHCKTTEMVNVVTKRFSAASASHPSEKVGA